MGTRRSTLAVAQAEGVVELLGKVSGGPFRLVKLESSGDLDLQIPIHNMAGTGVFAGEVQGAVLNGEVDVAVHSLKDLPIEIPKAAPISAIPRRGSPADVAVFLKESHDPDSVPPVSRGSRVGTSSPRRQSQMLALGRDLVPVDVRGNVETRLRKLRQGWVDVLLLAEAAIERLPSALFDGLMLSRLPLDKFPTCPGQGAVAIQTLAKGDVAELVRGLDDKETRIAVEAERRLLALLGGGCGMPLGATVGKDGDAWTLNASLARESWREEQPPRLARFTLSTDDPRAALEKALSALTRRQEEKAAPRQSRRFKLLLVADDETTRQYRTALEPKGISVESWYPFEYETGLESGLWRDLTDAWARCTWVALTSRRAVGALESLVREFPRKGPWVAVVGPRTASSLMHKGLPVHYVSKGGTASTLAAELAAITKKEDIFLYLSAKDARDDFVAGLQSTGHEVMQHAVYARLKSRQVESPKGKDFHAAVVLSPKGASAALGALGKNAAKRWVAIGPTTAQALETRGVKDVKVAQRRTPSGVMEALEGKL